MDHLHDVKVMHPISGGGGAALLIPLAIELGPPLIQWAMKIYQNATQTETDEQKRAHYAQIAADLEVANVRVQNAPLPPPGSGR